MMVIRKKPCPKLARNVAKTKPYSWTSFFHFLVNCTETCILVWLKPYSWMILLFFELDEFFSCLGFHMCWNWYILRDGLELSLSSWCPPPPTSSRKKACVEGPPPCLPTTAPSGHNAQTLERACLLFKVYEDVNGQATRTSTSEDHAAEHAHVLAAVGGISAPPTPSALSCAEW